METLPIAVHYFTVAIYLPFAAASIWFENWGVVVRVGLSPAKFPNDLFSYFFTL